MKKLLYLIVTMLVITPCSGNEPIHTIDTDESVIAISLFENQIAWRSYDTEPFERNIYYHDGYTQTKISTDNMQIDTECNPQVYDGVVVFHAIEQAGQRNNIFIYDGTLRLFTENNEIDDTSPCIYNDQIAWVTDWFNIMYWDGKSEIQITDGGYIKKSPSLHKGQIVWQESDGSDDEIFFWDGSALHHITDNDIDDIKPKIFNGVITWEGHEGSNQDVYYWDGETIHRLTTTESNNESPDIYDNNIVWCDGRELYLFDVNNSTLTTHTLSQNFSSPSLYKHKVAVQGTGKICLYDIDSFGPLNNTEPEENDLSGSSSGGCFVSSTSF